MMEKMHLFRRAATVFALGLLVSAPVWGQLEQYKDYREVYRDTVTFEPRSVEVVKDTPLDRHRVVTNAFGRNWFLYGTAGAHSFRGDFSNDGPFKGTISPDFSVGIGKWITPGVALKLEFTKSNSRGYIEKFHLHNGYSYYPYGIGEEMTKPGGGTYKAMQTGWWDLAGLLSLNLTRIIGGYEGTGNKEHMGQWMVNLGIGGVHHTGFEQTYGSDNEWSGHAELQYSQFFNEKKRVSLDLKARAIVYQSNFDLTYGQIEGAAHKFDSNLGLDVGFTFYLDKNRNNGWTHAGSNILQRELREREITIVKVKEAEGKAEHGMITFYVFYPNNYSGRNDAPNIPGATVNAVDYLAGGIFTQKQYSDPDKVADRLSRGASLQGLEFKDIPTERADQDFEIDFIPRGYEMLNDTPLSLSLKAGDMNDFKDKTGYYYAPIYDGLHTWNYRIDDATLRQQLISDENYKETATYGLNAHSGLQTIRDWFDVTGPEELVSFADVYAAINSNKGYISRFADDATVARIRHIINNGEIYMIQVEGTATSQDNFTGPDAKQVGIDRNTALSNNRANTIINWLKGNENMRHAASQIIPNNKCGGIEPVSDKSTRGLDAKMNRRVKVQILYAL